MKTCGLLVLLLSLFGLGCQTQVKSLKARNPSDLEFGPRVDALVGIHQDEWLKGLVLDPDTLGIQTLVVLGDSYSDQGNLHFRSKNLAPPEIYWRSRLSNGPIWVDYVQGALGWKVRNYTFVDVSSSELEAMPATSFKAQVERLAKEAKGIVKDEVLVSLWLGPDYYLEGSRSKTVAQAMADLKATITELRRLGFPRIVLGNLPELSDTPFVQSPQMPAVDRDRIKLIAKAHNEALALLVEQLRKEQLDLKLFVFQAFELAPLIQERNLGARSPLSPVPCYPGDVFGRFPAEKTFCPNPESHSFWDSHHPSSKIHCYFAAQFLGDIADAEFISGYNKGQALDHCRDVGGRVSEGSR